MNRKTSKQMKPVSQDEALFEELKDQRKYRLHGPALATLRMRTGCSISLFARLCSWSRQYQSRVESSFSVRVSRTGRETILRTLRKLRENKTPLQPERYPSQGDQHEEL